MRKIFPILFFYLFFYFSSLGQEIHQTFDDTRIVNGHSVETNTKGVMKFIISHRFGAISDGPKQAWGLDNASMRIGLDYGLWDKATFGLGRSTYEKTVDGFLKYRLLTQAEGKVPVSVTLLGTVAWKTDQMSPANESLTFFQRQSSAAQLLFARKFTDRISLQIMPTYLHRNRVAYNEENDIFSLGSAGQFQVLKNISLSVEYYYTPQKYFERKKETEGKSAYNNQCLALGVQFDTKGHIFQLHFGNSRGMTEKFFVAETKGKWLEGDIFFGFNITRDFTLAGRKIR